MIGIESNVAPNRLNSSFVEIIHDKALNAGNFFNQAYRSKASGRQSFENSRTVLVN